MKEASLIIPVLKKSELTQESSALLPGYSFASDDRKTNITMWDFKGVKQWSKCNFTPNIY